MWPVSPPHVSCPRWSLDSGASRHRTPSLSHNQEQDNALKSIWPGSWSNMSDSPGQSSPDQLEKLCIFFKFHNKVPAQLTGLCMTKKGPRNLEFTFSWSFIRLGVNGVILDSNKSWQPMNTQFLPLSSAHWRPIHSSNNWSDVTREECCSRPAEWRPESSESSLSERLPGAG